MKVNYKYLLATIYTIFFVETNVFAYDCEIDGFYYDRIGETEFSFAKCPYDYKGHVTIPSIVTFKGKSFVVVEIGSGAFYNCTSVTSVSIPNSITRIMPQAFQQCTSLTSITIPNSVTQIKWDAFQDCTSLTTITIPNSVTIIDRSAFAGCTSLSSISLPNNIQSIFSLFWGCTSLASITIPNGVEYIDYSSFSGCTSLSSIIIPNSVISIGNDAFRNCTSLSSISIPNSVRHLYGSVFEGCTALTSITIPNGVTELLNGLFKNCTSLKEVTIGENVKEISADVFKGTSALSTLILKCGTPPALDLASLGHDPFEREHYTWTDVYVPKGTKEIYKKADIWKKFYSINEYDSDDIAGGDEVQYLTIEVRGKPIIFALLEKPMITYQNNQLVITTSKETVEIPVGDISSIVFSGTSTAIHNLMSEGKPQVKGGLAYFSDLKPGTLVYVFTSDGKNMAKVKADYSGTAQVNLSEFPKGIYLIKAGKQTIKIINK